MFTDEIKEELINGLLEILDDKIESIILYGSVARGDSTAESDIDIAIILRTDLNEDEKNIFIHWNAKLDIKYGKIFSIIDIRQEQLEKWGKSVPFYRTIQNEGVVLWRAA